VLARTTRGVPAIEGRQQLKTSKLLPARGRQQNKPLSYTFRDEIPTYVVRPVALRGAARYGAGSQRHGWTMSDAGGDVWLGQYSI